MRKGPNYDQPGVFSTCPGTCALQCAKEIYKYGYTEGSSSTYNLELRCDDLLVLFCSESNVLRGNYSQYPQLIQEIEATKNQHFRNLCGNFYSNNIEDFLSLFPRM